MGEARAMGKGWILLAVAVAVGLVSVLAVLLLRDEPQGHTAQGRDAVLLIPGYGGDPAPLEPLRSALAEKGYDTAVLDIGEGTGDLTGYGEAAAAQAEALLQDGARSVSSVGFSAGGIIGRIAAELSPDAFAEVISLASPHAGTVWAALGGSACPTACQQMRPGSDLLSSLPAAPADDDWLSVYSTTDEIIVPSDSSRLPGATVLVIQSVAPGEVVRHGEVPSHPVVIDAVAAFLADEPVG